MIIDDIEQLLRKYLSAGLAVVVILVSPGAEEPTTRSRTDSPSVVTVEPDESLTERRGEVRRERDESRDRREDSERAETGARERASPRREESSSNRDDRDRVERGRADDTDEESSSSRRRADSDDDRRDDRSSARDRGHVTDRDNDYQEKHSRSDDERKEPSRSDGNRREHRRSDNDREDHSRSDGEGRTAAETYGWGKPNRVEEFDDESSLKDWYIYDGPGHAGNGRRTPEAVSVENGILTITGNSKGDTAGMAWLPGQKYGRWEGRVKAPKSDPSYNALLLLWPDAENFPVGGEIDFMEMLDHTRQVTDIFIHYGPDNSQVNGKVQIDATEWHNWAVEWTPEAITAYVDGEEWYRTTDTSIFPPGPMHLCIQLDWFPTGKEVRESVMYVDWVRQYPLDETEHGEQGDDEDRHEERTGEANSSSPRSRSQESGDSRHSGGSPDSGYSQDLGDNRESSRSRDNNGSRDSSHSRENSSRGRESGHSRDSSDNGRSGTGESHSATETSRGSGNRSHTGNNREHHSHDSDDNQDGERISSATRHMSGPGSGPIRPGQLAGAKRRVQRAPIG